MNSEELVARRTETIKTTLGDLVEAFTSVALEAGKTEVEGYKLASLALENFLNKKGRQTPSRY